MQQFIIVDEMHSSLESFGRNERNDERYFDLLIKLPFSTGNLKVLWKTVLILLKGNIYGVGIHTMELEFSINEQIEREIERAAYAGSENSI